MLKSATFACLAMSVALPAHAFEPTRPVEFVVTSGPGGGTDTFARTVQSIIARHELMDASVIVTNKGGGSGAEGYVYSAAYDGDPHKLTFGTNNQYLLPQVARLAFTPDDLTPVAALALDEFLIWVHSDSPHQTASAFIEAARAEPGSIQFGGSQSRDTDQILVSMIGEATGTEFTYIPFNGGGEAATQLAGGHIDANVNNPNENIAQWQAGNVRPLCVFRAERFEEGPVVAGEMGWHDIPTCVEAGVDLQTYQMPRTVWASNDVDPEVQAFYTDVMRRVSETPEWADYVERTSQTSQFMSGEDLQSYIAENRTAIGTVLEREGWLVN